MRLAHARADEVAGHDADGGGGRGRALVEQEASDVAERAARGDAAPCADRRAGVEHVQALGEDDRGAGGRGLLEHGALEGRQLASPHVVAVRRGVQAEVEDVDVRQCGAQGRAVRGVEGDGGEVGRAATRTGGDGDCPAGLGEAPGDVRTDLSGADDEVLHDDS